MKMKMNVSMSTAKAVEIAHTLSDPAKMPGKSYSLPTSACGVGGILREIEGSVCGRCYADNRGNYAYPNVKKALQKRLKAVSHPQWEDAMVTNIIGEEWFRWHDSGDVQSKEHVGKIARIAERLPDTNFWLPTKERKMVVDWFSERKPEVTGNHIHEPKVPSNLVIRYSMPMIDQTPALGALDKRLPYRYSMVASSVNSRMQLPAELAKSGHYFVCEARDRGNQCGYCRACWDASIPVIVYPLHN